MFPLCLPQAGAEAVFHWDSLGGVCQGDYDEYADPCTGVGWYGGEIEPAACQSREGCIWEADDWGGGGWCYGNATVNGEAASAQEVYAALDEQCGFNGPGDCKDVFDQWEEMGYQWDPANPLEFCRWQFNGGFAPNAAVDGNMLPPAIAMPKPDATTSFSLDGASYTCPAYPCFDQDEQARYLEEYGEPLPW